MLKKIEVPKSSYERYFKEADDEKDNDDNNVSVTVAPRENRGADYNDDTDSVTVAPRANRGTDYNDDGDDSPQDNQTDDNQENDTSDEPTTDDGADYNQDDESNTDDSNDNEAGDEGADGDATDDGPVTDDDGTDYNNDGDDDNSDNNDDNNDSDDSKEDVDEKAKKFSLYQRFINLRNAINSFIETIQSVVKNDHIQNAVIKRVTNNLNEIYDNMYDYMTVKFKSAKYIDSLTYFETIIATVHLNFVLLKNNKISLKQ